MVHTIANAGGVGGEARTLTDRRIGKNLGNPVKNYSLSWNNYCITFARFYTLVHFYEIELVQLLLVFYYY